MRSKFLWGFRILVGGILLTTAIGKLLDNRGFADVIRTYDVLPEWSLLFVGLGMSLTELSLSLMILSGCCLYPAAKASVALHVCFTLWAALALYRGLEIPNCGCFGVFLARPLTFGTIIEDLVMTSFSVGLLILSKPGEP